MERRKGLGRVGGGGRGGKVARGEGGAGCKVAKLVFRILNSTFHMPLW